MSELLQGQATISMPEEDRWYHEAACKGADREQFYFSRRGRSNGDPLSLRERYCGHCAVVDACLEEALASGDMHPTVLGGKTRAERRQLIRQQREQEGTLRRPSTATFDPERVSRFLAEFFAT